MDRTTLDPAALAGRLRDMAAAPAAGSALRQLLEQALRLVLASAADPDPAGRPFLLALDGRCAAGKTTLAQNLQDLAQRFDVDVLVLHMDDFFLPPDLRCADRLAWPGGNVHYERFEAQVLSPLSQGRPAWYQPFDCGQQSLRPGRWLCPAPLILTEGAYALHPKLRAYYQRPGRIFLDISAELQRQRLAQRCLDPAADLSRGQSALARFATVWIPLEERYISQTALEAACGLVLTAG
ncbi:MAG: uridine kinase [Oscillospiraceae bacterium]|nr:uridine kinase [Oscillospiraceae bacterium]